MVHISTATTIYIDATGTEETRTVMRAELVAIHMALATFAALEWIGILTDSLYILHAIEHHNTNPGIGGAKHYHHHMLLLESIREQLNIYQGVVRLPDNPAYNSGTLPHKRQRPRRCRCKTGGTKLRHPSTGTNNPSRSGRNCPPP